MLANLPEGKNPASWGESNFPRQNHAFATLQGDTFQRMLEGTGLARLRLKTVFTINA